MAAAELRIGIAGCGQAARIHLSRLLRLPGVRVVGCADPDRAAAEALAALLPRDEASGVEVGPLVFDDHRELLRQAAPEVLAIFTPHLEHYRPARDALQAGCHVFVEKPLTTHVPEGLDLVNLARARGLKIGVGHQYRLAPSLIEARRRLAEGTIGTLRLVTGILARPWLADQSGTWRLDPRSAGGGLLADAGDHLLDTLLWTTGQAAAEVAALQDPVESGLDLVTASSVRLAGGTLATLACTGVVQDSVFELTYWGSRGRLRASDTTLVEALGDHPETTIPLAEPTTSIDGDFVAAVRFDTPLCCPADQALPTVRLLEAVVRSARTGQVVRLA